MRKIVIIIIISFYMLNNLSAKEPLLARYEALISNDIQIFGIRNYTFRCKTYGIATLETLYHNSSLSSICQKSIERLYKKKPKLQEYAQRIFEYKQLYHIEIKGRECIVYMKGQISLSELLLRNGLAIIKPLFRDKEFDSYFISAQKKAKIEEKGLWSENIFNSCVSKLYK